jgi:hypothetical protein
MMHKATPPMRPSSGEITGDLFGILHFVVRRQRSVESLL